MTPLTDHFFLEEFCSSETAARLGQKIEPSPDEIQNITRLCKTLLEPIRVLLGRPMVITSGLRPLWLNLAIGGSTNSAHLHGFAADIKIVGMSPEVFARWIQMHMDAEDWPIDQCILEFDAWTHLSVGLSPRRQFLTAKKDHDKTIYLPGIVA